jgi:hypothetical protein
METPTNPATPTPAPTPARPRRKHPIRRADWVLEALRAGRTHGEIAKTLHVKRDRVRLLAKEALDGHRVEPVREHNHIQIARLRPALQAASDAVACGEVRAIYPLLKVLEKLDTYQERTLKLDVPSEDAETREGIKMFMEKIQMIKDHYHKLGLVEQVQTLAQAYALSEAVQERRQAQAAAAASEADGQEGEEPDSAGATA